MLHSAKLAVCDASQRDMFKKLFHRAADLPLPPTPPIQPMTGTPHDSAGQDAMSAAREGGLEVFACLTARLKKDGRVHIESMLCALGAVAGYACQAQLRAQARAGGLAEEAAFHAVTAADGKRYFFGDLLNGLLVSPRMSVWTVCSGAMGMAGKAGLLDANAIFEHAAASVGSAAYGMPRLPAAHQPFEAPLVYLKALWPAVAPIAARHCPDPAHWSMLFCAALKRTLQVAEGTIAPELAFRLVMESAVAMSKVDLDGA